MVSVGVEEIVVLDQEKQEYMRLSFYHIETARSAGCSVNFLQRDGCKPFSGILAAKVFSVYKPSESFSLMISSAVLCDFSG